MFVTTLTLVGLILCGVNAAQDKLSPLAAIGCATVLILCWMSILDIRLVIRREE